MCYRTADVASRRRLRSAATSTLVLPLTRRSTLGDRAFPVAASRAWNSLPTSVRDIQSLPAFRQKLKLTLFSDSFASWIQHLMDCYSCLDFSFVRCPCNSLLWQRHLNLSIYNNNNNNNMLHIVSYCAIVTLSLRRAVFLRYSSSKNSVTLKWGSKVTQDHWEWYHSIDCVWFPISDL